jgi:hypothetical protein
MAGNVFERRIRLSAVITSDYRRENRSFGNAYSTYKPGISGGVVYVNILASVLGGYAFF